jgi:hypothetical protein
MCMGRANGKYNPGERKESRGMGWAVLCGFCVPEKARDPSCYVGTCRLVRFVLKRKIGN